jgi:hypothetical protein
MAAWPGLKMQKQRHRWPVAHGRQSKTVQDVLKAQLPKALRNAIELVNAVVGAQYPRAERILVNPFSFEIYPR